MNYLSFCSGIEAATAAWHDLGFNPIGFSEIEPFPSEVLKHHYPHVTNYGDMTNYEQWDIEQSIDLIVGGTPCQAFSIAGLRKGFDDDRGNLTLTFLKAIDRFKPRWVVWENVPGVLSHDGGRTFGIFLGALAKLGYGFAYRILDAQYFGVPQRRRRIFLVAHLGDWRKAASVLFESKSLCGNTESSSETEQETTGKIKDCFTTSSHAGYKAGVGTLRANGGDVGGGSENIVFSLAENTIGRQPQNVGNGNGFSEDVMYTLNATGVHGVVGNGAVVDKTGTLTCGHGERGVCFDSIASGICALHGDIPIPRKLTPIECERLQGFPGDYTNIEFKGKPVTNNHRYKALGNSMAVPVMRWIGERVKAVEIGKFEQ